METNGKRNLTNRTKALNIHYFFIADQVEKGRLTVEYCPTGSMVANFFWKLLQGQLFRKMKRIIMGSDPT